MTFKSQLITIIVFILLQDCRISHSKAISGKISELEKELADIVRKYDVDDSEKSQTYTDKPQTYNDKSQTYNDKPQTYNDKSQTYNDMVKDLQTYSNDKKQNDAGLLKEDEALMKVAIEDSKKEGKFPEGFLPSEDDMITNKVKDDIPEFVKDLSAVPKRELTHWGKGKNEVPDKLPPPPRPKDEKRKKKFENLWAKFYKEILEELKKKEEMRKKLLELERLREGKSQTYNDKPQTYNDKPQTYNDNSQTNDRDSIPSRERPIWPEAPSDAKVEDILMTKLANKMEDMSKRGIEIPEKMVDIFGNYLRKRRLNRRNLQGR